MARQNKEAGNFVVTFPLKTEKWQEDRIDKILQLLTQFYNDKQKRLLAQWKHLSHSDEYKAKKEEGITALKKYMQEHGFSEFGLKSFFTDIDQKNSPYKLHGINSHMLRYLAVCAWSAWEKKLTSFYKTIYISLDNEINIMKTGESHGKPSGFVVDMSNFTITMIADKPHKHKVFTIPFTVNKDSEYELHALHCEMRNLAIVRKVIRGKSRYFVQFTMAGTPYNKGREMGVGVVGMDPGPSKIAVVSDTTVMIRQLAPGLSEDERVTARLRRKMDRSKRATNPHMYNEDGTINKHGGHFEYSNSYKRSREQLHDIQRKLAAKRKISHNILANELIQLGNEFHVEVNSHKAEQRRAKETTQTTKGKNRSKKRFGKSLKNHAPAEFATILKNKVQQYPQGIYVDVPASMACTQFDFISGDFTPHDLKERTITTADDRRHDRDAIAAFNIKYAKPERVVGKKKIEKSTENFDIKGMADFYEQFVQMEEAMNENK